MRRRVLGAVEAGVVAARPVHGFGTDTDPAGASVGDFVFADAGEALALVGQREAVVYALGANLDFVDDKDLVHGERGD